MKVEGQGPCQWLEIGCCSVAKKDAKGVLQGGRGLKEDKPRMGRVKGIKKRQSRQRGVSFQAVVAFCASRTGTPKACREKRKDLSLGRKTKGRRENRPSENGGR